MTNLISKLESLFLMNIALRAHYLLSKEASGEVPSFSPDDLIAFLVSLLGHRLESFSAGLVIDECIIEFILGYGHLESSILFQHLNQQTMAGTEVENGLSRAEYYYIHCLSTKKLLHLTCAPEKVAIGRIFKAAADALWNERIGSEKNTTRGTACRAIEKFEKSEIYKFAELANGSAVTAVESISITICGFHRSLAGLGEDARRLFDIMTHLGYRVELVNFPSTNFEIDDNAAFYSRFETERPTSRVFIFCMPVFEMARLLARFNRDFLSMRYVIGYWPWELTQFPTGWSEVMNIVNEVWASSSFLVDVYKQSCIVPVYHVPLCVELTSNVDTELYDDLFSESKVSYLSAFDFNSTICRKNPLGSIAAFKNAFQDETYPATLILKSVHGGNNSEEFKAVKHAVGRDKRIHLIDGPLSKAKLNGLIARSSAFLSLHRSEGFGRLLVESMLLGTPVIATDWSGSSDFIKPEHAFPVKYNLQDAQAHEYPFAAGKWAEPDLWDAAAKILQVAADPTLCKEKADAAKSFAEGAFSQSAVSDIIARRLRLLQV